jgi:hypothetical protein
VAIPVSFSSLWQWEIYEMSTQVSLPTLEINGVEYVRRDTLQERPTGNRAVVVVDRGWIWAGDVTEKDGKVILNRAVWVFRWGEVGFDGVISNPKDKRVVLKPMTCPVEIPEGSEIFRVPVHSNWGL